MISFTCMVNCRSYYYYDENDSESWLFVDDNELYGFYYYWDDDFIWDKSDIITIDNGYKHTNYPMKCVENGNQDICACQHDNHGPIYQCQQVSYHQHKTGIF